MASIPFTFAALMSLLFSGAASGSSDFWIFGAGLGAGVIIALALRRDLHRPWDGKERRRRAR